jgi:hypothetical protein
MQARLFTSPVLKASEVKLWCQEARKNKEKLAQVELQMKSQIFQRFVKKEKAAS